MLKDRSLKSIAVNYEPIYVFYEVICTVSDHIKWSHNELKRCTYGADTVNFSNERCPSYSVLIGLFPCEEHNDVCMTKHDVAVAGD